MSASETAAWRAAYTWSNRTAGIVRGISHAADNRLHALEMLRHSYAPGETVPEDVSDMVRDELDGFAALVERNRSMAFIPDESLQASRVVDAAPLAISLRGLHVDVFTANCALDAVGDPPAVLVPPRALVQALLLLLLEPTPGSGPIPAVAVRGEGELVEVVVTHGAAADPDDAAESAVRWLLRGVTPAVALERSQVGDAPAYRLSLPSLAASRATERSRG